MTDTVTISRDLARELLIDTISELSELAWSAGWMIGVEISLLVAMKNDNRNDFFSPELLSRARDLAEALNEWPNPEVGAWDGPEPVWDGGFIPFDVALAKYGIEEPQS